MLWRDFCRAVKPFKNTEPNMKLKALKKDNQERYNHQEQSLVESDPVRQPDPHLQLLYPPEPRRFHIRLLL